MIVPFAFILAFILSVGAILFVNFGLFDMMDSKFREHWISAWFQIFWPLMTAFHAPSATAALLSCWYASPPTSLDAIKLLGLYLLLILVGIEVALILDAGGLYLFATEFVVLSVIFLGLAHWRRMIGLRQES